MSTEPDYPNAAPPTPDELAVLKARQDAAADALALDNEVRAQRIRKQAAAVVAAELAGQAPPFDADLLVDVLARPQEPPHRVDGLIPSQAGTLIVAQRKTGKTTLVLNLTRSFIDGEDFLGRFPVRKIAGRVAVLNYEVSAGQLARWAHEAGVPVDRLYLVNLRGRRNPLGNAEDREHLAEQLRQHQVESLIVDPFGRAFVGKSQNDSGEVGTWLANLDRWARGDCGVADVILTAHAGWEGERTRGASALEDWADSIITLVRDKDDEQVRYLRGEGRDVLVEEDRLDFDTTTRTLTLAGAGSRKQATKTRNVDDLVPAVVTAVTDAPGITGYKLKQTLRAGGVNFHNGDELAAAKLAVGRGLLEVRNGPRNSSMYHPIPPTSPTYPDLSPPIPGAGHTTSPTSPIGERWNGDRSSTQPTGDRSTPDPTMDDAIDIATRLLGARPLGAA
jgi:hypothetical protein